MRGFDIKEHALACFGGAGGQHACAIARKLGISKIFIHRFSGILSAYGMGLADIVVEKQEPSDTASTSSNTSKKSTSQGSTPTPQATTPSVTPPQQAAAPQQPATQPQQTAPTTASTTDWSAQPHPQEVAAQQRNQQIQAYNRQLTQQAQQAQQGQQRASQPASNSKKQQRALENKIKRQAAQAATEWGISEEDMMATMTGSKEERRAAKNKLKQESIKRVEQEAGLEDSSEQERTKSYDAEGKEMKPGQAGDRYDEDGREIRFDGATGEQVYVNEYGRDEKTPAEARQNSVRDRMEQPAVPHTTSSGEEIMARFDGETGEPLPVVT